MPPAPRVRLRLLVVVVLAAGALGQTPPAGGQPPRRGQAVPLENPEALSAFRGALRRADRRLVRVVHLGDSAIGRDDFPHRLRRRFQSRFGDGGPGFVHLQAPTPNYLHREVNLSPNPPWRTVCFIVRRCRRDGRYGLGGAFVESVAGARSRIRLRRGRSASSAELWYLAHPRGGRLRFLFGDAEAEVPTRTEGLEDRWHRLEQPRGSHLTDVRAAGGGLSRAFGVVLENDVGVVWDPLSMTGAFTHRVLAADEGHFATQLAHRDPALVILNYGGNDLRRLIGGVVTAAEFEEETRRLAARVRRAVPGASCLVLGISDHTQSGGQTVRPRDVTTILEAQRGAAHATGCAFWDSTAAMGGPGSYRRWQRLGLAGSDGKHLSGSGREVIAERLTDALLAGF